MSGVGVVRLGFAGLVRPCPTRDLSVELEKVAWVCICRDARTHVDALEWPNGLRVLVDRDVKSVCRFFATRSKLLDELLLGFTPPKLAKMFVPHGLSVPLYLFSENGLLSPRTERVQKNSISILLTVPSILVPSLHPSRLWLVESTETTTNRPAHTIERFTPGNQKAAGDGSVLDRLSFVLRLRITVTTLSRPARTRIRSRFFILTAVKKNLMPRPQPGPYIRPNAYEATFLYDWTQ